MENTIKVGRRKSAVARVYLTPGTGKVTVNKKDLENFFGIQYLRDVVISPLKLLQLEDKYDVNVNVFGGGIKGQAEAIRMAIARCLDHEDQENNHKPLKSAHMLTRDSRAVERKKPGLRKARRRSQFSKR